MSANSAMISTARDLVNSYDELIVKMKILKEKVVEAPDLLVELFHVLTKMYKETREFVEAYGRAKISAENQLDRYLKTYYEYLVLISIPYVVDLLSDIKNRVDEGARNRVEEFIELFSRLVQK